VEDAGTSDEALGGLSSPTRSDATNREVFGPFQPEYEDCDVMCPWPEFTVPTSTIGLAYEPFQ